MADQRGDMLVLALSSLLSRRRLGRLGAAALTLLGVEAGLISSPDGAQAKKKRKKKNRKKRDPFCPVACSGKACGEDTSCPDACLSCPAGQSCFEGECRCPNVALCGLNCEPCAEGRFCDHGICSCYDEECNGACCLPDETCVDNACCPNAKACDSICCPGNKVCFANSCCTPDCDGKSCGADGCGGGCGPCAGTDQCIDGACCPSYKACNGVCCSANQFCSNGLCHCSQGVACGATCCEPGRVCGDNGECVCAPGTECGETCCLAGTTCGEGNVCCRSSCVGFQCGVYHDTCDGEPLDCGTHCRVNGAVCSDPENGGVCHCPNRSRRGKVQAEILACDG